MDSQSIHNRMAKIKIIIEDLINKGEIEKAKENIISYQKVISNDIEIISMKSVIEVMENNYPEAKKTLLHGLDLDNTNFDLLFNLGYIYEVENNYNEALRYYKEALANCSDNIMKENITQIIENIKLNHQNEINENRNKIAFFVKKGMDSFLYDIIQGLSKEYEVRKIIVTQYQQIDEGMKWADICWFEWCDELIIYGSKHQLAQSKKVICRIHRYEVFTNNPQNVIWDNVDNLIIVTNHLKHFLVQLVPDIETKTNIITINNGVNLSKFIFKERTKGYNLAYIGYLHSRKNPFLLLQLMKELVNKDNRYKLYIAGDFQDTLVELYWNHQIKEMELEKNIIFEGWITDISSWLEDKNYIISTSIHESFGYGIAEAMARGIKPIIHNFIFSDEIWDKKYLFNSINDAIRIITSNEYNSKEYRDFICSNYSLGLQISKTEHVIKNLYREHADITINEGVISHVKLALQKKMEFQSIEDLTLFIATYNRASILLDDLTNGYKLGNQTKVIVDDASDSNNIDILQELEKNKPYGIEKILFHTVNKGVAVAMKNGVEIINTKYIMMSGDDDIIYCNDNSLFKEHLRLFDTDYNVIVPRYIVNLNQEGLFSIGYDRKQFNEFSNASMLEYMFKTGEMFAFVAGAIWNTHQVDSSLPEDIFRNSEDYVMMAKILGNNLDKKIKVTDNYVYIRRMSNTSLCGSIDNTKLSIHLISLFTSGYYCLKNNLLTYEDIKYFIGKRGQLLEKTYGYGLDFSNLMIDYLSDNADIYELISEMKKTGILHDDNMDNLPKELIDIKKYKPL